MNDAAGEYRRRTVSTLLEMDADEVPEEAWAAFDQGPQSLTDWKANRDLEHALTALSSDAQRAWDSDQELYSITISSALNEGSVQLGGGLFSVQRNLGWERAMTTVLSAGWRIHTFAPYSRASGPVHIAEWSACFVRPR
jgi:hypothetical protein